MAEQFPITVPTRLYSGSEELARRDLSAIVDVPRGKVVIAGAVEWENRTGAAVYVDRATITLDFFGVPAELDLSLKERRYIPQMGTVEMSPGVRYLSDEPHDPPTEPSRMSAAV